MEKKRLSPILTSQTESSQPGTNNMKLPFLFCKKKRLVLSMVAKQVSSL
ncbi:hypothetical protein [Paenibacillus baekrokdamisoli]|nr:hypothetical protein [Paenibacillus baekrokdamisoli]